MTGSDPVGFGRTAPEDHDTRLGYEVTLLVLAQVVADFRARGDDVGLVDNGATNLAATANFDPIHNHRILDLTVAVNPDVAPDHAVMNGASTDDRPFRHD